MRHLISIDDLSDEELQWIVQRGCELRAAGGPYPDSLVGNIVGTYFRKTSTRTRTAFATGALRLGARVITFAADELQLSTGETVEDTGRVLGSMLDALVARTTGPEDELQALAGQDRMPVINAMSANEHPTQALADLTTLRSRFGQIEGLRLLYLGEGNSTAAALALGLTRFRDVDIEFRSPPGYGLPAAIRRRAESQAAGRAAAFSERNDMAETSGDWDVIYTTRWQTTGSSKADPDWRQAFQPFRVEADLLRRNPSALFMHDLPAHRGEEVTAEVLDGSASIAFDQAENKMYSAMAVLEWCLTASDQVEQIIDEEAARVVPSAPTELAART